MKPRIATTHVAPMGRVVDVSGLTGLEVGSGKFTVRIIDLLCPWNEDIWLFDGNAGALRVQPSGEEADAELMMQAISALVYGTHDPRDFAFRGWGTVPSQILEVMGRMFPRRLPHMYSQF
ncbi:MAG: sterol carrier protein domain-containing protein [Anaerolineae bacterium]|nr:sterol carrier protein domain-containing protein [Anaerolineae bacterium]